MSTKSDFDRIANESDAYREMAALDVRNAIGYRGFVSAKPGLNQETMIAGTLGGFMYWGQRVHIAGDLAQALEHHNNLTIKDGKTEILMAAFYLISDLNHIQLEEMSKRPREEITKFFSEECKKGVYYYDNQWVQVPVRFLESNFIEVDLIMMNPGEGYFFYQRGWFSPAIRGVIKFSNLVGSKTVKNIRSVSRNLYRKGFNITFNQNIEAVMQGCRDQARKGQGKGAGSRITDALIKSYAELLSMGKAYSVELRNSQGDIVAGTFGFVGGSELACDSVFYPAVLQENCENNDCEDFKSNIDYAKVVMQELFDRAQMAGFQFIDLGMVTVFTKNTFKAEYIPREEFLALLENTPEDVEIDFTTEWNPLL